MLLKKTDSNFFNFVQDITHLPLLIKLPLDVEEAALHLIPVRRQLRQSRCTILCLVQMQVTQSKVPMVVMTMTWDPLPRMP